MFVCDLLGVGEREREEGGGRGEEREKIREGGRERERERNCDVPKCEEYRMYHCVNLNVS